MRILTIVNNLGAGGAQGSAKNASLAYLEQGLDVAVLGYRGGGARVQPLRDAGAEVFVGGEHADELERAVEQAVAWRPNVVHVHRAGHAEQTVSSIVRRIKDAATARVAVIETNIFGRVDSSADEEQFDVHMLLTRYCLWKWRKWARGVSPQPVGAVAPNIVRSDGFYPAGEEARRAFREEHGIPQDAIVFGRVGQPMRTKWSHACFEAFKKFAAERGDAWFVAVGIPWNYHKYLATFPQEVRRRIVVIEFLHGEEALRACYAAMDVFLHSSRIGESFGLVLAEAMLCERPVITLSTPARDNSQLEVVGHERGGLIAANVSAMVIAMRRLADDAALRDHFGRQGRQWCLEQYDSPVVGRVMLRIAELAHQHSDRKRLASALEDDPLITTDVSDKEIRALLSRCLGKVSLASRFLVWLVHAPAFYQFWRVVRKVHRKLRGPGDKQRLMREKSAIRDAAGPIHPAS
jgi:glycosyltransferase involved in cell wall biosynthesis